MDDDVLHTRRQRGRYDGENDETHVNSTHLRTREIGEIKKEF